jgi:uncharacterized protein (TIGR02171 family)
MKSFDVKKNFIWSAVALVSVLLLACSDSSPTKANRGPVETCTSKENCPEVPLQDGFVFVKAAGKYVDLGTNSTSAKADERPQMAVKFSYDFQLGKHEVTCGEFNEVMSGEEGHLTLECENEKLPVVNAMYYDAVLYANALSRKAGLDTVYSYHSAERDLEGHCYLLDGFKFDPNANGFRLPTEAEWMLVAKTYGSASEGWTADNSDYQTHEVCSKNPDADICDLIGNALEWVNDWHGIFIDTVVMNFVGAPDGGSIGQRVVKGGSFRNSAESINLYNRGDVYIVASATKSNYVGFRLAIGSIPNAVWLDAEGKAVESQLVSLVSANTMRSLVGTSKAKLAFRNDVSGNLAFINYSGRASSVIEIEDSIEVYHPDISPDGKHVAFCTGMEGVSGNSSLYVRDLNAEGTNLVKLDVENASIPRWRVLENGDTVIVYVTSAANNSSESNFLSASTWQVKFANGKFEKPKKLFDGAYHGGISEDNSLAVSGARLLRARVANPGSTVMDKAVDTVWYNGEQACNASLAKDGSKRTLFLDFGGKSGKDFVGRSYATHERILVVNSNGTLIKSIASPNGYTFDHSEWAVGGKNLAVATLTNINGAHTKIELVNMADSSMVDLVDGEELWHPCLWITDNASDVEDELYDPDSAGVYFVEGQDWSRESFGYKMSLFWDNKDSVDILCVGSSRMENGIVPMEFSSGYAINMGHSGNDMNASLFVAENYGLNHLKRLKYIVMSIDLDLWQNATEFSDQLFPYIPGIVYDQNHDFWVDGLPNWFMDAVKQSENFSDYVKLVYNYSRGFSSVTALSWGAPTVELDSNWSSWILAKKNVAWNMKRLRNFLTELESTDVKVVGIIFPQNPKYRETGSWGRYGPKRSAARGYLDTLKNFQSRYKNFILFDENKDGDHDYSDRMALNTDHLSIEGASKMTHRVDSLLKALEE